MASQMTKMRLREKAKREAKKAKPRCPAPKCGKPLRMCADGDPACMHCDACGWCGDPARHAAKRKKPERGPRGRSRTCGCSAGILINRETYAIERCDDCNLFETDEDAMHGLDAQLTLLGDVYEAGAQTVADAHDWIKELVERKLRTLKQLGLKPRVD